MELESDENIPPPKDEKPNQTGYMSPFGFLAGVRAMLSPTVKDQPPSEGPETPVSRSVLRDVNMARSPKSKNDLSVVSIEISSFWNFSFLSKYTSNFTFLKFYFNSSDIHKCFCLRRFLL